MTFRPKAHPAPATLAASTLAVLLSGSAAMADLTAAQVWQDWRDYIAGLGYTVDAREERAGDTLILHDLAFSLTVPEEDLRLGMTMDSLRLTETGDGRVRVGFPARVPMTLEGHDDDGARLSAQIDYTSSGLDMIVSGVPQAMVYDYTAAEMAMRIVSLVQDGTALDIGAARVGLSQVAGRTAVARGDDLRTTTQAMRAAALAHAFDITDPEGERVLFSGDMADLDFEGSGTTPMGADSGDLAAMLAAGLDVQGRIAYRDGGLEYRMQQADGAAVTGQNRSESGELSFAMSADGLRYDGRTRGQSIRVVTEDLPVPMLLEMGEMGFALSLPVTERDAAQDFALRLRLGDLVMSDMLWMLFDPESMLPRDPGTLALDLTGKGRLLADLMDPEAMEGLDAPPAELEMLTLNDFTLSLAGARLTGLGAFTFDNSDTTSFEGFPAPQGALDLRLVGGNTLLDKLIEMGMVPEEDAMGVRMMMGLFAVPAEGEDTLTSRIEVTGDGQVLANGQRLR